MSVIHLFPRVFASLDGGSTQDIVARRAVAIAAANNADLLFGHVVDSVPFEANGADFDALHIVATYNLLTNATFLVERGLGYAFCIDGLVDARNARGLAFRPVEPALTLDACIAAKRHRTLSPAAKLFLERLRKEVGR